jgi:hypothetical protein
MSVTTLNISLVEGAKAYVREASEALATISVEPRFDIHFEGFGTGWTCGVPTEFALRYLDDLASPSHANQRYRTRIRSISVSVRIRDKNFSA